MKKLFLIAGHGQGDPGACSKWGQEMDYTRDITAMVAEEAKKYFEVDVYPFEKNCYKQSKNGNKPNYAAYDLTIEFHLNAKSKSDPDGDGRYTGVGGYYHPQNSMNNLSDRIVQDIANMGFRLWGNFTTTGHFNPNESQRQGAKYFLIELAFIDDGDDMRWYTKNKQGVARRIVKTICEYYNVQMEKPVPVKTGWIQDGNGKWWYKHKDGSYTTSDWEKIDGKWYYFDSNGWMLSNCWILNRDNYYFLKDNGVMADAQWITWKGKWYYLSAGGKMLANAVHVLGGKKYSFAADGHMETTTSNGDLT